MSTTLQEFSGNATGAEQTVAQIVQAKALDVDQQVLQTDNDLTDNDLTDNDLTDNDLQDWQALLNYVHQMGVVIY